MANSDFAASSVSTADAPSEGSRLDFGRMGCKHYRRRCKIRAPCCNEVFVCRHCHNESVADRHELRRQDIQKVICLICYTEQPPAQVCTNCGVTMGEYFCSICKFYDDDTEKKQYHCNDCGLCRVGGRENFFHCKKCGACYSTELRDKHTCVENSMRRHCPIYYEYLFDSLKETRVLKCGHTMHSDCLQEMLQHQQYACPICSKSVTDMSRIWRKLDEERMRARLCTSSVPPSIDVEPFVISKATETPIPTEAFSLRGQIAEHTLDEALDEVLGIEWPTVAPLHPKFITCSAKDFLGQLRDLTDRRPLPSWSEGREFLRLATLSYHAMGFAQGPWMTALEHTWAQFSTLQRQEFEQHRWLSEVFPQIQSVNEELEASKERISEINSELTELRTHEMVLIDLINSESARMQELMAEYQLLSEKVDTNKQTKDALGERIQDAEGRKGDRIHHKLTLEGRLTLLWESRPVGIERP